MSKLTIIFLLLPLMSGCSWLKKASVQSAIKNSVVAVCSAETKAFAAGAHKIAVSLNCTHEDVILADVTAKLSFVNVCKYVPKGMAVQGIVANMACPLFSAAAVGYLSSAVPDSWGCVISESQDAAAFQAALTSVCQSAIPL